MSAHDRISLPRLSSSLRSPHTPGASAAAALPRRNAIRLQHSVAGSACRAASLRLAVVAGHSRSPSVSVIQTWGQYNVGPRRLATELVRDASVDTLDASPSFSSSPRSPFPSSALRGLHRLPHPDPAPQPELTGPSVTLLRRQCLGLCAAPFSTFRRCPRPSVLGEVLQYTDGTVARPLSSWAVRMCPRHRAASLTCPVLLIPFGTVPV